MSMYSSLWGVFVYVTRHQGELKSSYLTNDLSGVVVSEVTNKQKGNSYGKNNTE